jgi:hypothetical protein
MRTLLGKLSPSVCLVRDGRGGTNRRARSGKIRLRENDQVVLSSAGECGLALCLRVPITLANNLYSFRTFN